MLAIQPTRWVGSCGARTCTDTASCASAVPAPNWSLMALATRLAVVKSGVLRFSVRLPELAKLDGTVRSTLAPLGMRPVEEMFTCTLEPLWPSALMPPTSTLPCAIA